MMRRLLYLIAALLVALLLAPAAEATTYWGVAQALSMRQDEQEVLNSLCFNLTIDTGVYGVILDNLDFEGGEIVQVNEELEAMFRMRVVDAKAKTDANNQNLPGKFFITDPVTEADVAFPYNPGGCYTFKVDSRRGIRYGSIPLGIRGTWTSGRRDIHFRILWVIQWNRPKDGSQSQAVGMRWRHIQPESDGKRVAKVPSTFQEYNKALNVWVAAGRRGFLPLDWDSNISAEDANKQLLTNLAKAEQDRDMFKAEAEERGRKYNALIEKYKADMEVAENGANTALAEEAAKTEKALKDLDGAKRELASKDNEIVSLRAQLSASEAQAQTQAKAVPNKREADTLMLIGKVTWIVNGDIMTIHNSSGRTISLKVTMKTGKVYPAVELKDGWNQPVKPVANVALIEACLGDVNVILYAAR